MNDEAASLSTDDENDFRELICRVRKGSTDAITELVRKYGGYVRRTVRRVLDPKLRSKFDSMDFVQMVFLSFFRLPKHAARLDTSKQFVAYVIEMARNKVFMEERHQATQKRDVGREVPLGKDCEKAATREPQPVDMAIAAELWEQILNDLSPRDRKIVELKLQGDSFVEIGEKLKIDPHTAGRLIHRLCDEILHLTDRTPIQ